MSKTFAQINCSLLRSKRLAQCNHKERWAYVCAHLTPLGNYTGLFSYPRVMWAQDARVPVDELDGICARLCNLGLVEYDADEELLRIVGFLRQRPTENASHAISLVADFQGVALAQGHSASMRLNTIAEFVVAAIHRSQAWKPDSPDKAKLRDALKPFLLQEWQESGDDLLKAIRCELTHATHATKNEMQSLFPVSLQEQQDTLSAGCEHRDGTRDVDETNTKRK